MLDELGDPDNMQSASQNIDVVEVHVQLGIVKNLAVSGHIIP